MNSCWTLLLLVLAASFSDHVFHVTTAAEEDKDGHFLNEWAVEIPGGEEVAKDVARRHGYHLVRALLSLPDHYVLARNDVPHVSRRSADHHTEPLSKDKRVLYAAQQQHKVREKRDLIDSRALAREIVKHDGTLNDPELKKEWYLNQDASVDHDHGTRADLKVKDVWRKGFTGKNVVTAILDDGLERDHPDLKDNYDPRASYDLNDNDNDPFPRYDPTNENNHGTRCAGEIAMIANNKICGVGIAFDSKIGGVRLLDGPITDIIEGDALGFNTDHIDIYSASWGPKDNGSYCDGPGKLGRMGLAKGIKNGRGGKGSLYVWASGNGGFFGDNCAVDGFTSNIYTIGVSSATQHGTRPAYGELCPSTLTTTYSSGSTMVSGTVTTSDMRHKCTNSFTGTSASAPMAAGILALLLEANPGLTWRDVKHIIVQTSRMEPLALEDGWYKNAAGYCVNLAFGFGLMDALAMIELANPKTWKHVPELKNCTVEPQNPSSFPRKFSSGEPMTIEFETDGCKGQENEVNYLEYIQVILDIDYGRRGNLRISVESPMGTKTDLLLERFGDHNTHFNFWPFVSAHTWGEQPQGTWRVTVSDMSNASYSGEVQFASLVLLGTTEQPDIQKYGPKPCGKEETIAEVYSAGDKKVEDLLTQILYYLVKSDDKEQIKSTREKLRAVFSSNNALRHEESMKTLADTVRTVAQGVLTEEGV